jgi:putative colanic acid biosynthesis UDP-glucose lipid carrier transferase
VKRLIDIVVCAVLLLVCLVPGLLIALAVKLDSPGPVLFRQRRIGYGGRPFHILKFRTMHVLEDGPQVVQARRDDPRVTRVGALLRDLSLDELPQLINVLAGDMSLVGPRPHAAAHDEYYGRHIANYAYRRRVRPGITGWAQINGARGATPTLSDMQARIDLDAWYVDHGSLALDLMILFLTPLEILHPVRE